jgi:hypothetical protein
MRTWIIGGCCGLVVGLPFLAVAVFQLESHLQIWSMIAQLIIPLIVNALLAVFLHKKGLTSVWLLVLPALFLIPTFDSHPKAITHSITAGLIWIAGCFSLFVVERCKPSTNPSSTSLTTESELS